MDFAGKYLILLSICIAVFYIAYLAFFRKEQNFKLLRFFLLSGIVFSIILPLNPLKMVIPFINSANQVLENEAQAKKPVSGAVPGRETLSQLTINQDIDTTKPVIKFDYKSFLLLVYLVISLLIFARLILSVCKILYLYFSSEKVNYQNFTFILLDKRIIAFTFFKWIFIDKKSDKSDLQQIIKHEKIHASQYHSIDVLLSELLVATLWFNPFAWMYKKALQQVHEFLADEGVINSGFDKLEYQTLLVNQAAEERLVAVSSNFSYSLIKKRIMMLSETKKHKSNFGKWLIMIPLTAVLFIGIACANAQNDPYIAAISPTKMNVLYIGVDNPVNIAVTGANSSKITAEIDNGSITGENGNYIVRVKQGGIATITVKVNGEIVSQSKFRVKSVPDPIAIVKGNWDKHELTRQELIDAGGIQVVLMNFDFDLNFEIVSFNLSAINEGGFLSESMTKGGTFSKDQIEIIKKVASGGKIYIEDIQAKGPDGSVRNLSPIVLKIK
ncbi:MAG: GldM family protein [Bacteroidales bacterium]